MIFCVDKLTIHALTLQLHKTLVDLTGPQTTVLLAHEHRQPSMEGRFYADVQSKLQFKCDKIRRRYLDKREDASLMSVHQLTRPGRGYHHRSVASVSVLVPSSIVSVSRPVSAASAIYSAAGDVYQTNRPNQRGLLMSPKGRPQSAVPDSHSIRVTPASRPGSAYYNYKRPQSARNSYDPPALTRSTVGELYQ
eukprot:scaffold219371_cov32-Prasinocladus_malaysianus.AAC.1